MTDTCPSTRPAAETEASASAPGRTPVRSSAGGLASLADHLARHASVGLLAAGLLLAGCDGGGANGGNGNNGGEDDTVVPAAPSRLEAAPGDGEVSLGWDAATDAKTYNVYRDTESGVDASGSPLDEGIGETIYTDETAENGTEYFYVVTGVADEEGDPSREAEGAPFTSPSGLEGTSGDSRVELSWDAAAGAETYNVYRDTESGVDASGSPLAEGVAETAFTDESGENGTTYYYVVTSVNANGEQSASSKEIEKAPFAKPPPPPGGS